MFVEMEALLRISIESKARSVAKKDWYEFITVSATGLGLKIGFHS